jgi:hypothetical protein
MYNREYKRILPHIHPAETALFITFRLYNSIPGIVLSKWENDLKNKIDYIKNMRIPPFQKQELIIRGQKLHFEKMDNYLHSESKCEKYLSILSATCSR